MPDEPALTDSVELMLGESSPAGRRRDRRGSRGRADPLTSEGNVVKVWRCIEGIAMVGGET